MEGRKIQSAYSLSENDIRSLSGVRPDVCFCEDFGKKHIAALSSDGHVLCAGDNSRGQCETSEWHDICSLFTGEYITAGLDKDENAYIAGCFVKPDQDSGKKAQKSDIRYRIPEDDISPYGSMVDFTNKILGTGKA